MSAILGSSVTGAGGGAYTVDNSLRFRSSASAYLNRTPASASNRRTWTYSAWAKRGTLTGGQGLLDAITEPATDFFKWSNGTLVFYFNDGSSAYLETTAEYRDPAAWYHLVLSVDTTQATASNRIKLYVNGVQVTSFSTATYPSQNYQGFINNTVSHKIGVRGDLVSYLDGYLAEVNFIDGQALSPSSFGATNASTGVWQPKAYTGSYGTNGFYLKFSDIATTSGSNAGLGKDFSGNTNYWNTNNISVTSGVTYDAMTDSPTPKSSDVCNYAVLNPINGVSSSGTYSNGNLQYIANTDGHGAISTILVNSGKWYWEGTFQNTNQYGIFGVKTGRGNLSYFWTSSGYVYTNAGWTGRTIGTYAIGDVISITVDYPNDVMKLYKNNVYIADLGACSYFGGEPIGCFMGGGNTVNQWTANFGQRPFAYSLPSGFNKLCTYNITTPTIGASSTTLANKYFDATLYTGNGSTQTITNSGSMQPDLVWMKARSTSGQHALVTSTIGVGTQLSTNNTVGDQTATDGITSLNSNGFSLGAGSIGYSTNNNGTTYVGWQWKANGGSTTSNTNGSITSTVQANTTSGFSVVTYTGTGSNATVGHGLGVAPKMVIVKKRSAADSWQVYHASLTSAAYRLVLNDTAAQTNTPTIWNSTAPTSTVFSIGTDSGVNTNTGTYVAYCFAEVAGFSKFGSYTGNGSSDGPFVYCGFRPKYVMIKAYNNAGSDWNVLDSARGTYNANTPVLLADLSNSEFTASSTSFAMQDFLSNGFKLRSSSAEGNGSGWTYIYMAFAENPFNYSLAR